MGKPFVPPAAISEDGTAAVITIPLEQSDEVEVVAERVAELRALAAEDMPAGIAASFLSIFHCDGFFGISETQGG